MGDGRIVNAEMEIRQALSTKGKRYGKLDAPYLIVIADCKEELVGGIQNDHAVIDAVFGTVVTQTRELENGERETKDVRLDDGYWGHPNTARHKNVSGVLLLPKPHLWDLRNDRWQPLLICNPWADHPLPDDFLALPGYSVDGETYRPADRDVRLHPRSLRLVADTPRTGRAAAAASPASAVLNHQAAA
jgi:hypothetical protein